jgi:hypothetical protein
VYVQEEIISDQGLPRPLARFASPAMRLEAPISHFSSASHSYPVFKTPLSCKIVHYGIPSRSCGHFQAPSWAPRGIFIAEPSEVHSAYARYVQMNAPEIPAKCSCPQGKDCIAVASTWLNPGEY